MRRAGAESGLSWSAPAAAMATGTDHDFVILAVERNKLKK
jgi:hypothetical protein